MVHLPVTLGDDLHVILRLVVRRNSIVLINGTFTGVVARKHEFHVAVNVRGPWRADEIDHLEFTNDYEIEGGFPKCSTPVINNRLFKNYFLMLVNSGLHIIGSS